MAALGDGARKMGLPLTQGVTFTLPVRLTNADGTPFDLTGYTASAQVRKTAKAPTPAAVFAFTPDANPATGRFTMTLSAAKTAAIPVGDTAESAASQYLWDMRLVAPDASISLLAYGLVAVRPGITR